jgi:UV DNA damage endonuclease
MRYGYACLNTELSAKGIRANRSLMRKTFHTKGINNYEELVRQNIRDLKTICQWNVSQGIDFYRISADLFSQRDLVVLQELPSYKAISRELRDVGDYVQTHGQRISMHADHFTIMASQKANVVNSSIVDLNFFGQVFDIMGLPRTPEYKINIHVGTFKPTKPEAGQRFVQNIQNLNDAALSRLTVENDDGKNGFSISDLYNYVYNYFKIPIVFDYHHHRLNPGGLIESDALRMALSTWPKGITPATHYSSSRKINENPEVKDIAHADYIYEKVQTYGLDFDIMFEAKMKEQSTLRYRRNFLGC